MMRAVVLAAALLLPGAAWAGSQSFEVIERGRVLATMGDCVACHSVPGGVPFTGGLAIETPFGAVVTPNLTPDLATGLGAWSDAEYLRAMQQGIGREGEYLYPAFPYPYYSRVSTEDLLAIRAFLATLNPVSHPVLRNQLNFPFDIRLSMLGWNMLYFSPTPIGPTPGKSDEWQRGAYIVEGLGHCGACHTPKNMLGADDSDARLHGGALQDWFAPALNSDPRTGLGNWSVAEVVEYLQTGRNAKAAASGPMAEVVTNSTSKLQPSDLRAIAVYLKDQPAPTVTITTAAADTPAMQAGAALYVDNCAACHTTGGGGVPHLFPSLRGAASVQSSDPASLMRVVLTGTRAAATDPAPTGPAMPAFGWKLTDEQVASVTTYIRNAWGNAAAPVAVSDVRAARGRLGQSAGN